MRSVVCLLALSAAAAMACASRDSASDDGASNGDGVVATPTFGPLDVPVGVALIDRAASVRQWCGDFEDHALSVGDTVTLVWPDSSTEPVATARSRVIRARPGRCSQLPGDTAKMDDPDLGTVYELALVEPADSSAIVDVAGTPAIAIRGSASWTRGSESFPQADLDGDENPEQARVCTSNEGIHLTLWTLVDSAATGNARASRRWRAYQSLGYDVEPSCTERETDDPPEPAAGTDR